MHATCLQVNIIVLRDFVTFNINLGAKQLKWNRLIWKTYALIGFKAFKCGNVNFNSYI